MRLHGWCTSCQKIKLVRAETRALLTATATRSVIQGVCDQCERRESVAGKRKAMEHLGLPKGFDLVSTSSTHMRVVCPDGEILRMPNGVPVLISLSPGITRTKKIEAARIQKAIEHREGR